MATIVQCNCGAEYRRTEQKFLAPHTGDAVCTVCGAALESWWKSTHVPSFELIKRPDRREMKGTPRAPWTPERDKELRELVFSASSAETIAKVLNRTTSAVRHRASILRLPLRKIARHRRLI